MKNLIIISFFLLSSVLVSAQEKHFIFIQTDNNQAFYVQLNGKLFSSSASGYMIIPKLVQGKYNIVVGFPLNIYPEQSFECLVESKDMGFSLKNFGDKGWGLFNLQTYEVVKATPANTNAPPTIVIVETPKKEEGEPVISFNKKPTETKEPKVTIKPIEKETALVTTEILQKESIITPVIFKADIKSPAVKEAKIAKITVSKPVIAKTEVPKPVVVQPVDTVVAATNPVINPVETVPLVTIPLKEESMLIIDITEPVIITKEKTVDAVTTEPVSNVKLNTVPLTTTDVYKVDISKPETKIIDTSSPVVVKDTVVVENTKSDVKKVNEIKNEDGLTMVFVDDKGPMKDTILALIPVAKAATTVVKIDTPLVKIETAMVKTEPPVIKTEEPVIKAEPSVTKVVEPVIKTEQPVIKPEEPVVKVEQPVVKAIEPVVKVETSVKKIDSPIVKTEVVIAVSKPPVSTTPVVESKVAVVVKDTLVPQSVAYDSPLNEKNVIAKEPNSTDLSIKPNATYIVTNKCTSLAFEEDYYKLRKKMLSQMSDEKMIAEAKKAYQSKCFTTAQIKALSVLFMSDEGRYKFFDASYNYVVDSERFTSLQSELFDAYYIGRFKAMLR